MFNSQTKRICIRLSLVGLSVGIVCLLLNHRTSAPTSTIPTTEGHRRPTQTRSNAYIITADCGSIRFNATKQNVERVFPNFFHIHCFPAVPLNDSRIYSASSSMLFKKWSSNLLTFVDLWTYEIPKSSSDDELDWSFIFEDDVNFCDPSTVSLPNFIVPLQQMMSHSQVQGKDGFFYLGICGPEYANNSQSIVFPNTNNRLISRKGFGFCLHATGITAKRSKTFWSEIASYRPNANEKSLDYQLREFTIRSETHFYTFGSNFHYPPGTGHFGVAFQDRGKFWSTVT